ncbi:MAG: hypothetical protein LQ344_004171 [Seirophora lacunosa]|nr:MAG: hypothetical protein LQ344_004171 [Seirophora lacunosa]
MALTIIRIPDERVRFLRVVHAIDINKTLPQVPPKTIRVRRRKTKIVRVAHAISAARRFVTGIMTPSAFPSSTYLRKRYKTLQKCQVSRPADFRHVASGFPSSAPPAAAHHPSFDAIRALNRQPGATPEHQVVRAAVEDTRVVTAETLASIPVRNATATPLQRFASPSHESRSFSTRLDKLVKAAEAGQHIRFAPSDRDDSVEVFANGPAAAVPGVSTEERITERDIAHSHHFHQVADRRRRSPYPTLVVSSDSDPHRLVATQDVRGENTGRRTKSPSLPETPQQQLSDRMPSRVTESFSTGQGVALETAIRHERRAPVDPRVLETHGRDGVQRRFISPIPLDYQRPRGLATPSIDSSESGPDRSSPSEQVLIRQAMKERRPANSTRTGRSATATPGGHAWFPELAPTGPRPLADRPKRTMNVQDNPVEQQDKTSKVGRWLHHVKEALVPATKSPTRETEQAIGVLQDAPSSHSINQAAMPIARTRDVLRDRTNVRQVGHPLLHNCFMQEMSMQQQARPKRGTRGQLGRQPAVRSVHPPARPGVAGPQAGLHSQSPGRDAVTVTDSVSSGEREQGRQELHPRVNHALARLEGRVAPPSSSPIRRYRDDTDTYGEDVEVELGRLRMDIPRPLTTYQLGVLTERFDEAVDAGFDCALEAPISPETQKFMESSM